MIVLILQKENIMNYLLLTIQLYTLACPLNEPLTTVEQADRFHQYYEVTQNCKEIEELVLLPIALNQ